MTSETMTRQKRKPMTPTNNYERFLHSLRKGGWTQEEITGAVDRPEGLTLFREETGPDKFEEYVIKALDQGDLTEQGVRQEDPAPQEEPVMERQESKGKVYRIPVRQIVANTNPRNPLALKLQRAGWNVFEGKKAVWPLATSDNPEERAEYVKLIDAHDPAIKALATTLLSVGQLQPVEVRENGSGRYTLVFGCRRCLAVLYNWCVLGKPREPIVEARMVKGNNVLLLHRAVIENIRKNPNPIEVAKSFQLALNNGETEEEIAQQFGITIQTVRNKLALLELPPEVQKRIERKEVKQMEALDMRPNGKPKDKKPRLRSRKLIEETLEEFAEDTPGHRALAWVLGLRENIKD